MNLAMNFKVIIILKPLSDDQLIDFWGPKKNRVYVLFFHILSFFPFLIFYILSFVCILHDSRAFSRNFLIIFNNPAENLCCIF